jgi:hypothetical protein
MIGSHARSRLLKWHSEHDKEEEEKKYYQQIVIEIFLLGIVEIDKNIHSIFNNKNAYLVSPVRRNSKTNT